MKAILTVGIPGSGKSTWAKKYQKRRTGGYPKEPAIVERDMVRAYLQCGDSTAPVDWAEWQFSREGRVTAVMHDWIRSHASVDRDVIVSDTNLNRTHRKSLTEFLETLGYEVEFKVIDVPLETALEQNKGREGAVKDEVIRRFYTDMREQFLDVLPDESPDMPGANLRTKGTTATMGDSYPFSVEGEEMLNDYLYHTYQRYVHNLKTEEQS